MAEDRMLSDEVLLALINKKGGGGGTSNYNQLENKPQINGVTLSGDKSASDLSLASLDANGKVPAAQLPSYVDDVINGYLYEGHFYEDSEHQTEITGESGKIYIDLETNKTYRWSGLAFVEISESLALGETASTAYAGDKGKANADAITAIKDGQTIDSFGDVESALADKVDKVNGKGLSTNDYTDADKAIVGGVTAALAGKQDALTAGTNIKIDNDTISVNRWAVPAGKVVYTVITSDENYGQNVHVQRHTLDGSFIDDRTFLCAMYSTVTIDDLISIWNPYSSFKITLLKDSDEQQAGYNYTVNPLTTPTSTSFTFMMEQEENDNDLIIREELDAVSSAVSAIKDGTSIDSFADVETALSGKQATLTFDSAPTDGSTNPVESNGVYDALANKQNATDNNLQTTDKTVVGAVNELKSGLTNVQDDFTDVIGWNHRKNLFDKNATNTSNGFVPNAGLGSDNSTSATNDSNVSEYIPVTAGVTYTWQALVGNQASICFYNSEKTYITGYTYQNQSEKTITAPTNSAYARFTVNKANIDITQMEVGSTATQYEPYHPVIGTAVEELQGDLSSLGNHIDFTASNKITVTGGDITKVGNTVFIDITIQATEDINAYTAIISGLPTTGTRNTYLSLYDNTGNLVESLTRVYGNALYSGYALTTNSGYFIKGFYIV